MISGVVQAQHPLLPVTLRLPGVPDLTIDFVVDTGFVGYLTLPPNAVQALGLPFLHEIDSNLADNSQISTPVHEAVVMWHGVETTVRVLAMGVRPLLGMALLNGSELVAQCRENGLVTVDEL